MTKAYIVASFDVPDQQAYKEYADKAGKIVEDGGGTFLVRTWDPLTLDGEYDANRLVVIEFPDERVARATVEALSDLREERDNVTESTVMLLAEGYTA